MDYFINLLAKNWLEAFGTLSGLVYIFFSVKQNIWLWPIGIITSLVFFIVFFKSTLYADSGLQLYYFFISIYGWYFWLKPGNKKDDTGKLEISLIKVRLWPLILIVTALMGLGLYLIFSRYTNATNPMWDSLVSAGSITATWMLARKYLEQWLAWVVVDGASIALFMVKGLYFTAFLTFIYTLMAVWGFLKWYKDFRQQKIVI